VDAASRASTATRRFMPSSLPPTAPLTSIERRAQDFSDLSQWMAHTDQAIRHARHTLIAVRSQTWQPEPLPSSVEFTLDVADRGDRE
jgi:hypothetical protein